MRRRTIPVTPVADNICLGCGLCCDGTLFDWTPVRDDELAGAIFEHGASLRPKGDGVDQPCPAVADGCCQIYHLGRPQVCGEFTCDLYKAVEDGSIARADAGQRVAEAIDHRDVVRRQLAVALGRPLDSSLARAFSELLGLPPEQRAEHREVLIEYAALRLRLTRYFSSKIGFRMGASAAEGE